MPLKKTKVGVLYHRYLPGYSAERFAIDAEELGFDSLWVSENTFSRAPKADPFVVLGIFAAVTNRPLIGTAVVRLPLRSPAAMAKACAYVDQLSNGRLIFGIGVGGDFPEEFTAAGIPFVERGARTDECMDILKALWKNAETTFHGRFYQFDSIQNQFRQVDHHYGWVGVEIRRCDGRSVMAMVFSPSFLRPSTIGRPAPVWKNWPRKRSGIQLRLREH